MSGCDTLDATKTMVFHSLIGFLSFGHKDINFNNITNNLKDTCQFISRWCFSIHFSREENYWKINGIMKEKLLNISGSI